MPVEMSGLVGDLAAETEAIRELVAGLDAAGWQTPTPAAGWSVADQVSHLAFFDDAAVIAATDADRFAAELGSPALSGELSADALAEQYRALSAAELLAWFDASRARLIGVFSDLDPGVRLPWFGPAMSAASAVTARIMETWAHGQDVADALGVTRPATRRLKHVAYLGVRARPYSYAVRGLAAPVEPIRIELVAPDGELWAWGEATATHRVTGPALDFCLLVTQRRHRDDLAIEAEGAVAGQWLEIAQAFAGPPGTGRRAGQHR